MRTILHHRQSAIVRSEKAFFRNSAHASQSTPPMRAHASNVAMLAGLAVAIDLLSVGVCPTRPDSMAKKRKQRSAKQKAATKRMLAAAAAKRSGKGKRTKATRSKTPGSKKPRSKTPGSKKPRTAKQKAATARMLAANRKSGGSSRSRSRASSPPTDSQFI